MRAMAALRRLVAELLGLADEPSDDDAARVRKRVGIVAGLVTVVAPLTLPSQSRNLPAGVVLAVGLSLLAIVNLIVLARTRRFERYVLVLIGAGALWVPAASAIGGGITGAGNGLVWNFLVPAYAILALGPRRALPWFGVFLLGVAAMVIVDPFVRRAFGEASYEVRLVGALIGTVVPLTIVFALLRYTDLRRQRAEERSEELLTNAIPASIARRLKRGEERIAELYPEATVLFADIAGFTPWSARTDPERVVSLLDDLFTRLDGVMAAAGMEKIKTVGDAYMAVAGAPQPSERHAQAALTAGQGLLRAAAAWRSDHGVDLEVRVGLASGQVIGGVIGQRRILFDLWGDTVNLASRMESSGVPGRIQVADSTRALLPDQQFESREVDVKGLGRTTTYLLR